MPKPKKRVYTEEEKEDLAILTAVDKVVKDLLKRGYGKCLDKNYEESCVVCRRWRVWKEFLQAIRDDT